jgi:predicted nucleotidyltransferase
MLLLGSQAAQVFERGAFKLVVWVGVFGSFSRAKQRKGSDVDLAIFYDPAYSEEQIWEWYSSSEESDRWEMILMHLILKWLGIGKSI